MRRVVYCCLLRLHPAEFRTRFAEQMLSIFDETPLQGNGALLLDATVSLARQWVLRSRWWIAMASAAAAFFEMTAGGFIWVGKTAGGPHDGTLDGLIRFILVSTVAIVAGVAGTSLWIRRFARQRARR